ncbi:MAG: hypothetical protein QG597_4158 [Actinomycetota bacterium]|nr:hypothetical protein [Actinomycetota bacterium]
MTGKPHFRRGRDDHGAASVFCAISSVGLLTLIGLAVDGGAKVRAIERADTLAAEAARTAGQAVDLPTVMSGGTTAIDPAAARAVALAYLTANDATGSVTVVPGGRRITVQVSTSQPTVLLGLIGIHRLTAQGRATATLLHDPRMP